METKDNLTILWTSGDKTTFDEMVYMYALNSLKRSWWKKVTLVIGALRPNWPAKILLYNKN